MASARRENDDLKGLIAMMREFGAGSLRLTPKDAAGRPLFTLLLVDTPDDLVMSDLDALEAKWNAESDAMENRARP